MRSLLWFLTKTFTALFLSSVFLKWFITFMNIGTFNWQGIGQYEATLIIVFTSVSFIVGFAFGLIWGEENAWKRHYQTINEVVDHYYSIKNK